MLNSVKDKAVTAAAAASAAAKQGVDAAKASLGGVASATSQRGTVDSNAAEALVAMGFVRSDAEQALMQVGGSNIGAAAALLCEGLPQNISSKEASSTPLQSRLRTSMSSVKRQADLLFGKSVSNVASDYETGASQADVVDGAAQRRAQAEAAQRRLEAVRARNAGTMDEWRRYRQQQGQAASATAPTTVVTEASDTAPTAVVTEEDQLMQHALEMSLNDANRDRAAGVEQVGATSSTEPPAATAANAAAADGADASASASTAEGGGVSNQENLALLQQDPELFGLMLQQAMAEEELELQQALSASIEAERFALEQERVDQACAVAENAAGGKATAADGTVNAGTAAVPQVDSKPAEQPNAGDSPNLDDLKRQLSKQCAQEERLRQERQAMEARIAELQHEAEERVEMRLAEAVASSEAEAAASRAEMGYDRGGVAVEEPCSTPGTNQEHRSISPSRSGHDVAKAGVHQKPTLRSNSGVGGNSSDLTAEEQEALRLQAFKAVVRDDTVTLADVLAKVPNDTWSSWQNKAAQDLLTLSFERGSPASYSMMAAALGIQRTRELVTPAVLRFLPGTRARLCGLKAKPDLNGRVGIAIAFVAGKGRWQVQLEGSSESILIREECLEPIDEQPTSGNNRGGRDAPEAAGGEPVNKSPEVEKKKKKRKKKATGGEQSVFESTPANSRADARSGTGAGSELDQPEPSTYESTPKQSKADTSSMAAAGMESEQADSVYENKPKESKADVTSETKLGAINVAEPTGFDLLPKKSSEVSHGGAASDPNETAPSTFESNPSQSRADTGSRDGLPQDRMDGDSVSVREGRPMWLL